MKPPIFNPGARPPLDARRSWENLTTEDSRHFQRALKEIAVFGPKQPALGVCHNSFCYLSLAGLCAESSLGDIYDVIAYIGEFWPLAIRNEKGELRSYFCGEATDYWSGDVGERRYAFIHFAIDFLETAIINEESPE